MTHSGDATDSTLLENRGTLDNIGDSLAGAGDDELTEYGKNMFDACEAGMRVALTWRNTPISVVALKGMIDL